MRRLAFIAIAASLGCSENSRVDSGPLKSFYRPMGIAVHDGKLVVASSNFDLLYADDTGGSVIAVNPVTGVVAGALNIQSFAGEMAIADPASCPAMGAGVPALALVPVRGANLLYRIPIGADGALSCEGCEVSLADRPSTDPFAMGVACGPGFARAYVGYLRSIGGAAWVTELDLSAGPSFGALRHVSYGVGQIRGFAFDASRKRLYLTQTTTGSSAPLRWVDLAGGCSIDGAILDGGCRAGLTAVPPGLELHGIALSSQTPAPGAPRRAYLSARIFDPEAAALAGFRVGDFDGLLLVADLVDDVTGQTQLQIVKQVPLGYGASGVALLPARTGKRDAVAALAADEGVLVLYDDETDARAAIGRDDLGHPLVGATPFGLAVDPVPNGNVARVYVGSFQESFVTPIDVPLDDVDGACLVRADGECAQPGDAPIRFGPEVRP